MAGSFSMGAVEWYRSRGSPRRRLARTRVNARSAKPVRRDGAAPARGRDRDSAALLPRYDLILRGDGSDPMDARAAALSSRVADALDGGFGCAEQMGSTGADAPLATVVGAACFTMIGPGVWEDYATRLAPRVLAILHDLGIGDERVVPARRAGVHRPDSRAPALTPASATSTSDRPKSSGRLSTWRRISGSPAFGQRFSWRYASPKEASHDSASSGR